MRPWWVATRVVLMPMFLFFLFFSGTHIAALMKRKSLAQLRSIGLTSNELCGRYGNKTMEPIYKISRSNKAHCIKTCFVCPLLNQPLLLLLLLFRLMFTGSALLGHGTLTALDLQRNGITADGGRALAESLRTNTALVHLQIGGGNDEVNKDFISKKLIQTRTLANGMLHAILLGNSHVDAVDRKKQTCLHIAADAGSVEVARRLLSPELNAQSDLRNFRSLTPLHCAIESRDAPMITVLLSQTECDLTLSDSVGTHCLGHGCCGVLVVLVV